VSLADSSTALLQIPTSVNVAGGVSSISFTATAGAFTAAHSVAITASKGDESAVANITLLTAATTLFINGDSTDVSGVANGSAVHSAYAPPGFAGTVVANGTGSVNFAAGSGVYFLNCCSNTNDAYYKFTGTPVGDIFGVARGQISLYLFTA
jgi:hypothetical protein